MTFLEKVEKTEDIKDCLKPGLQALTEQYKNKIQAKNPRKINGSIFLEECLDGAIWDYIIGYNDETFVVVKYTWDKHVERILEGVERVVRRGQK